MSVLLTRRHFLTALLLYLVFALAVMFVAPFIGSEAIDLRTIISDVKAGADSYGADTRIFIYQRIPRVLLGFLVGGSLALVGSVLQIIFRNPLAAPSTLGITAGCSLGAVLAISVPQLAIYLGPLTSVQIFALIGSALTLGLIYFLARRTEGLSMYTLLLAGVTIGIFSSALIQLIRYLSDPNHLVAMDRWIMGGLDVIGYQQLGPLLPLLLPGAGLLFMQMRSLNHLSLGKDMALGHGVDVAAVQKFCFWGAGLVTAGAVSFSGPIFFVGLLIPHAVRRLSGLDQRIVMPASFLAGGAFLIACDTAARTIVAPTEMPVGIITAIVGGPFFIYLLLRKK